MFSIALILAHHRNQTAISEPLTSSDWRVHIDQLVLMDVKPIQSNLFGTTQHRHRWTDGQTYGHNYYNIYDLMTTVCVCSGCMPCFRMLRIGHKNRLRPNFSHRYTLIRRDELFV